MLVLVASKGRSIHVSCSLPLRHFRQCSPRVDEWSVDEHAELSGHTFRALMRPLHSTAPRILVHGDSFNSRPARIFLFTSSYALRHCPISARASPSWVQPKHWIGYWRNGAAHHGCAWAGRLCQNFEGPLRTRIYGAAEGQGSLVSADRQLFAVP